MQVVSNTNGGSPIAPTPNDQRAGQSPSQVVDTLEQSSSTSASVATFQSGPQLPAPSPDTPHSSDSVWQVLAASQLLAAQGNESKSKAERAQQLTLGKIASEAVAKLTDVENQLSVYIDTLADELASYVSSARSQLQAPYNPYSGQPSLAQQLAGQADYDCNHVTAFGGSQAAYDDITGQLVGQVLEKVGVSADSPLGQEIANLVVVLLGNAGFSSSSLSTWSTQQALQQKLPRFYPDSQTLSKVDELGAQLGQMYDEVQSNSAMIATVDAPSNDPDRDQRLPDDGDHKLNPKEPEIVVASVITALQSVVLPLRG